MTDLKQDRNDADEQKHASKAGEALLRKTPMYLTIQAERYYRQSLIRDIQSSTGRVLICFICGCGSSIHRDDTVFFVDLLHNLKSNVDLDLMLHCGGGDIDAAEKLVSMVRSRIGNGQLRVIVPDYAKSAATLMAIGGDKIIMSDTSELGPIDPQVTGDDHAIAHSVQSYLDAYESHAEALKKNRDDPVARLMLEKFDPATIKVYEAVRERARKLAEALLGRGMLRGRGNFTKVAFDLMDTKRWLTHSKVIGWQDAIDIGLEVLHLEPGDPNWEQLWQLYCHQRYAIKDHQKLFESDYVSLVIDA